MAGVLKKKKPLFSDEPVMTPRVKSMHIREADGGFIVGSEFGGDKQRVAKSLAALVKMVKAEFGGSDEGSDEEDE